MAAKQSQFAIAQDNLLACLFRFPAQTPPQAPQPVQQPIVPERLGDWNHYAADHH